jgi:ribosomal protein L37E
MQSIPTRYNGITFRSKLEAQWAKYLDYWHIRWDYEPEGYVFRDGTKYLPDFFLPESRTFLEVKGLMDQEDWHKVELLTHESGRPVVIGYAMGQFRACDLWEDGHYELSEMADSALIRCRQCGRMSFIGTNGSWRCRCCGAYDGDGHIREWWSNDASYELWCRFARIDVMGRITKKKAGRRNND